MALSKEFLRSRQPSTCFGQIVNLVPVMPLDGGQLLRIVMEAIFGVKGFRYALIVSMGLATAIGLGFFLYKNIFLGAIFFLLAFQSYETWRFTRSFSEPDRRDDLKSEIKSRK